MDFHLYKRNYISDPPEDALPFYVNTHLALSLAFGLGMATEPVYCFTVHRFLFSERKRTVTETKQTNKQRKEQFSKQYVHRWLRNYTSKNVVKYVNKI